MTHMSHQTSLTENISATLNDDADVLDGVNIIFENESRSSSEPNFSPTPYNFSDVHGHSDFSKPFLEMPKKTSKKPSYWMLDMSSVPCDQEGWSYSESLESWIREYNMINGRPGPGAHKLAAAHFEGCGFRRRAWRRLDIGSRDEESGSMISSSETNRLVDDECAGLTCIITDNQAADEASLDSYLYYGRPSADRRPARSVTERETGYSLKAVDNYTITPDNTPVDREHRSLHLNPVSPRSVFQRAQSAMVCNFPIEDGATAISSHTLTLTAATREQSFEVLGFESSSVLGASFSLQHQGAGDAVADNAVISTSQERTES